VEVTIRNADQAIRKDVTATGNGAHVVLPKEWLGQRVTIVLHGDHDHAIPP
jgi:putative transposon-encoded protein